MEFCDQLRIAREAKQMSHEELATAMGVTKSAVVWWETPIERGGNHPRPRRLEKLQQVLGVTFYFGQEPGPATPGVRPEHVRLAIAISRLPKAQRQAITALVNTHTPGSVTHGRSRQSFYETERTTSDRPARPKAHDPQPIGKKGKHDDEHESSSAGTHSKTSQRRGR